MTNLQAPNLFGEEISPSQDGAKKFVSDCGLKPIAWYGENGHQQHLQVESKSQIWEGETLAKNFWLVRGLTLPNVKEVEKLAKVLSGWKARRYAAALLHAAVKANEVERIEAEVKALTEMLNRSPQLVKFLAQPLVPFSEKAQRLKQRLEGRVSPMTLNFLLAVVKHKRIEAFDHIVKVFVELVREYRGEVLAEVTSAVPLTDEERAITIQRLQEITGKKVLLSEKVDPNIVGGMRIIVGDKLLDLSLRGHLERIRERLRQVFVAIHEEAIFAETAFNTQQKSDENDRTP